MNSLQTQDAGAAARTVVVGAGIIGVTIAFELQRRGKSVLLLDRDEPGLGASFGNMASIAVTEFMPSSRPSTWRQMPAWLLDPEGPIRLRPAYLPRLLPWFLRFLVAGRPARVAELTATGAQLSQRVYQDWLPMLEAAGLSDVLSAKGCLSIYGSDAELKADREQLDALARHGFSYSVLGGAELQALEPALSPAITKAILLPSNRSVRDPYRLLLDLLQRFRERGGVVGRGQVAGFDYSGGALSGLLLADGRRLPCGDLILAAGAQTGQLSRQLGDAIPLETERGYHTQIMAPGIALRHSLIWHARAFMVTPTAGGIRVGGSVEMAGLDAAPDYRRARVLVRHARQALPGLQVEQATEWMGHRPALPDTVPIISRSAKVPGVFYATGHGHLGLTYAATTARLLADLVTGCTPPMDMRALRVDRF